MSILWRVQVEVDLLCHPCCSPPHPEALGHPHGPCLSSLLHHHPRLVVAGSPNRPHSTARLSSATPTSMSNFYTAAHSPMRVDPPRRTFSLPAIGSFPVHSLNRRAVSLPIPSAHSFMDVDLPPQAPTSPKRKVTDVDGNLANSIRRTPTHPRDSKRRRLNQVRRLPGGQIFLFNCPSPHCYSRRSKWGENGGIGPCANSPR